MSLPDQISRLMQEVGEVLEIAEVSEAEDGQAWALALDEEAIVFAELDEPRDRLVLSVDIGPVPDEGAASLYELLLVYNGQWSATGGIRMTLDEPGGRVVQIFDLTVSTLDVSTFAGVLVTFLEIAAAWRRAISGGGAVARRAENTGDVESDPSEPDGSPPDTGLRV